MTTVATTFSIDVPNAGLFTDVAHCAPGSVATGGGYDLGGYDPKVTVALSRPDLTGAAQVPTGWLVRVQNLSGVSVHLTIYAVCAQPVGG